MKKFLRRVLHRLGFELLHRTDDPVLAELRALHESLRLAPPHDLRWLDGLPHPAAHANLRHLLQHHQIDLLLDVGANRGQFARLARRLGYAGEIVSFEPLARHREELERAAKADGRWRLMPLALGATAAELDLHVCHDDVFSSLRRVNAAGRERFHGLVAESHVERVGVRPLDALWPEISGVAPRRVFLKTDTQGHDLAVLEGAVTVLRSTRALLTEAALQPIYEGAPLYAELAAWLAARGFRPSGLFPLSHREDDLSLIEIDAFFTRTSTAP